MTQIEKIEEDKDTTIIDDMKNNDLETKLQIWLLFGSELIENNQMWKWWKWLKQPPNIPNMMIIYWQEQNQQKKNYFWKIMQNRPVTARQNQILEPKEKTIQMILNLIFSIQIPGKQQISLDRSFYYD